MNTTFNHQNIGSFTNSGTVSITIPDFNRTFTGAVSCGSITISGNNIRLYFQGNVVCSGSLSTSSSNNWAYLGIGLTHSFTNISFFQPSGEYLDVGTSMLNISGSLTLPDAVNFTAGSGTVNFNGSGAQIIPSSSSSAGYTFNNLTLSNGGIKTLGKNINVNCTLSLQGTALLAVGGNTLTYGGSSTLEYAGSSTQTSTDAELPASGGPHSLTINNNHGVILHAPRTITGVFTLTLGSITISATNLLTFTEAATVDIGGGVDGFSFVDGPMAYVFTTTGLKFEKNYPIGKGTIWRPLRLTLYQTDAISSTYTAEVFNTVPVANTLPVTLAWVSGLRYYTISENGSGSAFTDGYLQILWCPDDLVTDFTNLIIVQGPAAGSGSCADLGGTGSFEATTISGNVTSTLSSFKFSRIVLPHLIAPMGPCFSSQTL
jgi:hypothetical protein